MPSWPRRSASNLAQSVEPSPNHNTPWAVEFCADVLPSKKLRPMAVGIDPVARELNHLGVRVSKAADCRGCARRTFAGPDPFVRDHDRAIHAARDLERRAHPENAAARNQHIDSAAHAFLQGNGGGGM